MDSADLNVLRSVLDWRRAGERVLLYTVVQTWGSAPRPPGAMLALRGDGMLIGSVSGGCIEDDLIERLREGRCGPGLPVSLVTYWVTREGAARFGLPCGGTLRLTEEEVLAIEPDERTAIVALTHDPRLDDMALLTALQSRAFYVGALGSRGNSAKRRERLAFLGLAAGDIARLHGPVGLPIGSRVPAEIALSLLAEIVVLKNGMASTSQPASQDCGQPA